MQSSLKNPGGAGSLIRLRSGRVAKPLAIATAVLMLGSSAFPLATGLAATTERDSLAALDVPSFDFPTFNGDAGQQAGGSGPGGSGSEPGKGAGVPAASTA